MNGTTVLSGLVYEPFDPPKQWTWGNATVTRGSYNADGKVTQIVSSDTHTYAYDDAFRLRRRWAHSRAGCGFRGSWRRRRVGSTTIICATDMIRV